MNNKNIVLCDERSIVKPDDYISHNNNQQYYLDNKDYYQEYYKEYYEKHREHFRDYYLKHKEKLKAYFKQYKVEHYEEIKEKGSVYHLCECGRQYQQWHKSSHEKSKYHQKRILKLT